MLQSYFLFTNLFFRRTVVRCGLLWQRANARKVSFFSVKIWPLPTCLIPNIIFILSWKVFAAWLLKRIWSFVEFLPLVRRLSCLLPLCRHKLNGWQEITLGKSNQPITGRNVDGCSRQEARENCSDPRRRTLLWLVNTKRLFLSDLRASRKYDGKKFLICIQRRMAKVSGYHLDVFTVRVKLPFFLDFRVGFVCPLSKNSISETRTWI